MVVEPTGQEFRYQVHKKVTVTRTVAAEEEGEVQEVELIVGEEQHSGE